MTTPARITQADMDRATKAVAASGIKCARIIMDLANQRIEIIVSEPGQPLAREWSDDDV